MYFFCSEKTYRIADNIETEESKKRKRTKKQIALGEKRLETITDFCDKACRFYFQIKKVNV